VRQSQYQILPPMRTGDLQANRQPACIKPQGTEIAGNPHILNGPVLCSNFNSAYIQNPAKPSGLL
jgi:hypothetical protein